MPETSLLSFYFGNNRMNSCYCRFNPHFPAKFFLDLSVVSPLSISRITSFPLTIYICAKKKQLRNDLRNILLDNHSISEYLLWVQTLIDSLSYIRELIPTNEHVDLILDGLPNEFESLVMLISCGFEPLTIDEVETLLLAHETRIEKSHKKLIASINLIEASKPNFSPNSWERMSSIYKKTAESQFK